MKAGKRTSNACEYHLHGKIGIDLTFPCQATKLEELSITPDLKFFPARISCLQFLMQSI
ncbi:hypothetical protein Spb1_25020 [Planctopirus ephydatiae]|uniref:Uncharacterized protein n=1 Tax=Planctopirus ephydatiae TaxID=2528019 RepID=A0A518GPL7_9PLAN|nr:hypothetical protein Spb1_25020 [Planctopirus ephydatiae]